MRTIKFRGKSKKTGEWLYGSLLHRFDCDFIYTDDCNGLSIENEVDTKTIGQFTGLYDKNGREIYEGDIVKWEEFSIPIIGIISWRDFGFCVEYYRPTGTKVRYMLSEYDEVIGNIHDNHELLKQQEHK